MSSISKINISDTDYTLNASSINDYNSSDRKIQVGFAGAGLTSSNLGYVAGYTADGTKIKDVNKAQMQSWLGLGSAAYANLNTLFNRHLYPSLGSTQTGNTPVWLLGLKSAGYPVYTDPEFANGYNNVYKYANSGEDNLAITRGLASDFEITDPGNSSKYVIQIKNTGTVVPGLGGFYQIIYPRANAICIQIFRAMIPSGYSVNVTSNSMGTSYQDTWLTSNTGTGKWEWYIRSVHCGSTGTFANGGHVYLTGTAGTTDNPVIWYLSYCNYIDITKGNYDGLRTRYSDSLFTARNLKIGNTSKSFNGSGDVSWSLSEIGCLPLSGGTMSGDIVFQYNAGIRISTDSAWYDSFRSIPFSGTSTPSKIQWYSTNATTGLTFNPSSGTLRTGDFQSESRGFVAPAMGSNPRTAYGASMIFYNCNPDTTSYYNFGVHQWDDEFQFNYRTSATNVFQGNSFTIRGSDGLFCIVNRPVIGSYTSGKYVLHSGDVTGGGSTGGSSLTVYDKTLTIPTSLPASDVYSWAKASTKPSYSWSEITSKPSTFAPSSHTHSYIPLSGGTMTGGQIARTGSGGMLYKGRDTSLVRTTDVSSSGWNVITSLKTKNGDWSMGVLGSEDMLRFCYTTDTNFTAGNNDTTHALRLDETGNLITLGSTTSSKFIKSGGTSSQFLKADGSVDSNSYSTTSHTHTKSQITDFPASLKNPNSLTVKLNSGTTEDTNLFTYNGSAAKTVNITPSGIGAATNSHTHNYASTVKIGSTSYSVSSNTISLPAYPTAASLGLSSAMKFIGTTTTALTDGATTNPITISSTSVTATSGNVVLYGNKEFLWNGSTSKWEELGDESSHALKTVSIKAGTGLSGGGTLEADRTLSLSAATSSTLGGIKTGYTESGKNYKVQLDSSNNAYVNVPWTDTNTNQTVKGNGTAFGSTAVINIVGSGATTVTADTTNNNITISSTDTNTWRPVVDNLTSSTATTSSLSAKQGYLLANGSAKDNNAIASLSASGTTITYTKRDGSTGTITTQDTNTNTAHTHTAGTGLSITGSGGTSGGVTYTLNKATESTIGGVRVGKTITDTSSYTQCPVDSNGTVYYKDTNTNTTYSAGKGLSLSGTTFSLDSSKPNIMFGVCETAGATAVKVCIIKNGDINLNDGTIVNIFFKYANTAYPDQTCVSFTTNADGSNPVNPMNMYSGYTSAAVAAKPSYVDRVWGNIQFGTTYTFVIYNSKLYLLNDSNGAKAFNYCDTTITIDAFLTNVLGHGAATGSFFLKTAFSKNNVTVSASRYYYIFLPYRDGVVNSSTDDTNVRGCLILVQGYVAAGNTYGKTGYYVYIDECEVQKVQQFLPVTITPAYGTCSTAAATAAKEVTVPNVVELVAGTEITVYFSKGNTASNVTLNVNSLGAKSVRKAGNTTVGSSDLLLGIYKLVYSGSYWFII